VIRTFRLESPGGKFAQIVIDQRHQMLETFRMSAAVLIK
jgi:hypothetical protein